LLSILKYNITLDADEIDISDSGDSIDEAMAMLAVENTREQGFRSKLIPQEQQARKTRHNKEEAKEEDKSPGGCLRLIQDGVCKLGSACKYLHEPEDKMKETWLYYAKKLLGSKYRIPKEELLKMYPTEERKLRLLTKNEKDNIQEMDVIGEEQRRSGLFDEDLSDDVDLMCALLATSFPALNYAERVHKDGLLEPQDSFPIPVKKVLFDSGAQHASYISSTLVNKHRSELAHLIQKVNGEVKLGDNN
jgi:hypothetical protein